MKNNSLILTVFFCVLFVMVFSCKKSPYINNGTTSISVLFKDLKPFPQTLSVTAGRDTIIFGTKGTGIHFYANSFKTAGGSIITSGTINIQLIEIYKPGDMVANRAPTTSDAGLLQSGGEVNISATMNGQKVQANKYGIAFKQSGPSTQTMNIFYGDNNTPDSVINWTQGNVGVGTTSNGTIMPDSTLGTKNGYNWGGGYYHLIDSCTSFEWANCDRLYSNTGSNTTFRVKIADTSFKPANTQIFLIIPSLNLMTMSDNRQTYDSTTNTITVGNHENEVPVGLDYKVVIIANKNNNMYYAQYSGTLTDGILVNASLVADTRSDIISRLSGL